VSDGIRKSSPLKTIWDEEMPQPAANMKF